MKFRSALLVFFLLYSFQANSANEKKSEDKLDKESFNTPAQFEADSMDYDEQNSVITATGNVQVTQSGRVLIADKVKYDRKNNKVEAEGNISLMEPDGNVVFADSMQLKADLKEGVIGNMRAKFKDNSSLNASSARRVNEDVIVLRDVSYTPCTVCKDDPKKAPLWQVSAKKATLDNKKESIRYNSAFFEVKGVPVLYTPYLAHPSPNAKRKSGFLIPKYSSDRIFGSTVTVPYYINIAPNKDLTLSPVFTTKEGAVLSGEYRHMVQSGEYRIEASGTNPNKVDNNGNVLPGHKFRGHIEGDGDFDINEKWSWGFDGKRSTDDTYLRRYNFGDEDVLTSKIYATSLEDRNYIRTEAITFQGLRVNDDPGKTPLILPYTNAHYETEAAENDSRWMMDGNLLSLTRDEGVSSHRISAKGGWKLPHITRSGHVMEFNTSLRGDGYFVDDVPENPRNPNSKELRGFTSRVVPQAEAKWALPMMRKNVLLEPTVRLIASPYGGNPNKIHNEDSQDIEFSDENLFDANHFTGFDRLENGPRVNYGMRGGIFNFNGDDDINFLFGQNYRAKRDRNFSASSGLDDYFSDYVGMIGYDTKKVVDLTYRFRIDNETASFNRNSVSAGLNLTPVRFGMDYVSIDDKFDSTNGTLEEKREIIIANSTLDINKSWELSGSGHRDIENGKWVATKANLLYKGDCVNIGLELLKEYTRDRDVRPNTTIALQLSLKNMGY